MFNSPKNPSNPKQNIYTPVQTSPFYLSEFRLDHLSFCLMLLTVEMLLFPNMDFEAGHILREDAVAGQPGTPPLFTGRCFLLAGYPPLLGLVFCLVHVANYSINRKHT